MTGVTVESALQDLPTEAGAKQPWAQDEEAANMLN